MTEKIDDESERTIIPDPANWITVSGARTNNLRDVSLRIPKHQITVLTGVSGSGKSSLAFGTIAATAQKLVAETYPSFIRNRMPSTSGADVDQITGLTFAAVVDQRPFGSNARSTVGTASDIAPLIRLLFSRISAPSAGFSPAYSFNHPDGMCPTCEGLGVTNEIDVEALLDLDLSLHEGAIRFPSFMPGTYRWKRMVLSGLIDPDMPLRDAPKDALHQLLYARGLKLTNPDPNYVKSKMFDGVIPRIQDSYLRKARATSPEESAALARIVTRSRCRDCGGTRLNDQARASRIDGRSIVDWMELPISELRQVVGELHDATVSPLVDSIIERLDALQSVGLGYLSLARESSTLSGGEAQRVKVVRYLGSGLSDVCYVFDEPSAGLHPHDVHRLLGLLKKLRDSHSTVIVVEHNQMVIEAADHIIDLGPGAGAAGGNVLFEGPPQELLRTKTPTGRMLQSPLEFKKRPRRPSQYLTITDAFANNLQNITIQVPLGVLTAVAGVAGSGKTSLIAAELPRQHPDFTIIDQSPLRGSSRSTPASLLGIAEHLRAAFSAATGMPASWFSPNGKGACPNCNGKGIIVTDLAFMDDVQTVCEACSGTRFNPTALSARLGEYNIAEVLAMNAAAATPALAGLPEIGRWPSITRCLARLSDVGLGYLSLGQPTTTLSGGERQRLQLARTLLEMDHPNSLRIILDEPTSGLHADDVSKLLRLFDQLVDDGATVIVIEHDQQVICHADYVIEVGPGAGGDGGKVVYAGPPTGLLTAPGSLTGEYLRRRRRRAHGE